MCGIVGVWNSQPINNQDNYLQWALADMQHRGPDSSGVFQNNNYACGFVRLAIRDLSASGNQPMHSLCNRYVLVFNGEIYNADEYKLKLINLGYVFRSSSDTEVLLNGLKEWKEDFIKELNGIFAFAFYDKQENELILARDRMGIKPLYVGYTTDGIVFSSQYNHVVKHDWFAGKTLNRWGLQQYLSFGYMPHGQTIIDEIEMLEQGTYWLVNTSTIQKKHYYNLVVKDSLIEDPSNWDLNLRSAMDAQMISDVPLGTFLSGGVDSPIVAAMASSKRSIQSFTIGAEDKQVDESAIASMYAKHFNTQHHTCYLKQSNLINYLQKFEAAFSEPFGDISAIPTLALSEFAKQNVTVALSGDGGDELFWGYPRNINQARLSKNLHLPKWKKIQLLLAGKIAGKAKISRRAFVEKHFNTFYIQSLFIPGAANFLKNIFEVDNDAMFKYYQHSTIQEPISEEEIFQQIRILELKHHLPRILLKVDRASMFNSLEVRVPMLDNLFIDHALSLSFKNCIHQKKGKYPLKQWLANQTQTVLPFSEKKGFVIPLKDWINIEMRKEIEEKILDMPQALAIEFNRQALEQLLKKHQSHEVDLSWMIWTIYSLSAWYNKHKM